MILRAAGDKISASPAWSPFSESRTVAMFDQIEKLKRDFTDKYVVVDASRPELQRFQNMTGQVKTVNMSGRALVRFEGGDNNIGWFDINPEFLKFVPKPEPKPEEEKHAKPKPAAAAKPAAPAATKPAAAATAEKKPSVAEMLRAQAAAKAGGAAPAAAPAPKPAAPEPAAAAPEPEPAPAPAAPEKKAAPAAEEKKLSTAEILAKLRKKP